jgi:hypothetical protein
MDCSDDHMSDGRANLGHDGQNGADSPISIMVSLVVDDDSRGWRERYRRHWGWLWTCLELSTNVRLRSSSLLTHPGDSYSTDNFASPFRREAAWPSLHGP